MTSNKKFNAKTKAIEIIEGRDLNGYEVIITGASSGIGFESARVLAKAGARVIIATRDLNKARECVEEIKKETGNEKVEAELLDLASLNSVHAFAKRFLDKDRPLHILVNNAGVMGCPLSYTEDGFEMQIGTNHIGHFALTLDLLSALKRGARESKRNARVVNVSSLAHCRSDVIFDDINFKSTPYDPFISYGQSKTANSLFSIGLTKRYSADGIYSNSLMPGAILTGIQRHMSPEVLKARGLYYENGEPVNKELKTIEEGASTIVYACLAPELENRGGLYLQDCDVAPPSTKEELMKGLGEGRFPVGVATYALDEEAAERLWKITEEALRNIKLP